MTPANPRRQIGGILLILLLALLAIGRSAIGTAQDGFTVDEPWHIVAGTSYARGQGYHLNPEHPPLVKRWVGAMMPRSFRIPASATLKEKEEERRWVQEVMYRDNVPERAQAVSRPSMWILNGLLLCALGVLLWRAFGLAWAVGTLGFLALDPTVAAHLPVVMTDLPLGLTLCIAALCAGLLASTWRWRWALATGAAMGLALTAKHSALAGLAGLGLLLLLAAQWGWKVGAREALRRSGLALAAGLLAFVVLWSAYDFRFHADPDGGDRFNRPMAEKIADLRLPHWKTAITVADAHELLPRSYLWGLADTVRTGVEGRSGGLFLIWGRFHEGAPPWFSWPAILAAKIPLALMALALAGLLFATRLRGRPMAGWSLLAVVVACAFHMAALVGSGGVWGGVRHALPVLIGLAVLAGAVLDWAWRRRSRALLAAVAVPYVLAAAMTIREPSAWEYYNELIGGSGNAYRYFEDEGLGLGQRYPQMRDYYRRVIAPSGLPMYSRIAPEEIMRAEHIAWRRQVETLDDTNVEGRVTGWFVMPMNALLKVPQADWDPARDLKGRTLVARFGNRGIWKGTQNDPLGRAGAMAGRVMEYIYRENGDDWTKVAARLEEVAAKMPMAVGAHFELGNAYVRLGKREAAVTAYNRIFEQTSMPVDPLVAAQVKAQIALLKGDTPMAAIGPLRNPWRE